MYPILNKDRGTTVLKKGFLQKKGKGAFSGWSSRYFLLRSNGDFGYYADRNCKKWKGNIDLQRVTKIIRKDKKNLILVTPDRKWQLLCNKKVDLDHWQQLISNVIILERNNKKKKKQSKLSSLSKPLPLKQSHSDNRDYGNKYNNNNIQPPPKYNANNTIYSNPVPPTQHVQPVVPVPLLPVPVLPSDVPSAPVYSNINHNNNNVKPSLHVYSHSAGVPAFNPDVLGNDDHKSNKVISYADEGTPANIPAYIGNDLGASESKIYKKAYLCIWRIREQVIDNKNHKKDKKIKKKHNDAQKGKETKKILQILMGIHNKNQHVHKSHKKNKKKVKKCFELSIFGGRCIKMKDVTPTDCVLRNFRVQTAEILDATICDQIKQSLITGNDRQMYWSGNDTKSIIYFYEMDYDYGMVNEYKQYNRLNELYFDNLYWINWKDIYKHSILYLSNPDPVIVDKQKCTINHGICQLMITNEVSAYFHSIKQNKKDNYNVVVEQKQDPDPVASAVPDDDDKDINFDPYGPSAPIRSDASILPSPSPNFGGMLQHNDYNFSGLSGVSHASQSVVIKEHKWQWFDGDKTFSDFDKVSNNKLENMFAIQPDSVFNIKIKDQEYQINLKESTQKNIKTNRVRLLRRFSYEDPLKKKKNIQKQQKIVTGFASNGNVLSYNPEWKLRNDMKQKQIKEQKDLLKAIQDKKQKESLKWQYMEDNVWIDYDKDLCIQIQIASVSMLKYRFTSNKGDECQIDFGLMEERNIDKGGNIKPVRKLDVEMVVD